MRFLQDYHIVYNTLKMICKYYLLGQGADCIYNLCIKNHDYIFRLVSVSFLFFGHCARWGVILN